MEVVVVYESDAASELRIECTPEDLLQVVLADIVGRMRFASKHDLHGATWCGQNLRQAIGIRENQLGTLIAGESPGESDRERVVVEQRRGRNDPGCAHMTIERADSTIRYRSVSFTDPDEILLLPGSIETTTVVRNSGSPRTRITQTFTNYRRFVTGSRLVQ